MLDIDPTLPSELGPLQWLIGSWEGTGVLAYDAGENVEREFGQRVSFKHHGLPYLAYEAYAWMLDDELTPLAAETGYWRLARPAEESDAGPGMLPGAAEAAFASAEAVESLRRSDGAFEIQALISHPPGVAELYLGTVHGPRIELATDAVLRGAGAKEHSASTRMLGLVDQHLLWAWDIAALGLSLRTHASARLARNSSSNQSDT